MTPEKALEIVSNLQGEEGIVALQEELEKHIKNRGLQIASLQGEINAFKTIIRTLSAISKRWGVVESEEVTDKVSEKIEENSQENTFSKEVAERIKENKCSYKAARSNGGKWCRRKLKTKKEKEHGYCSVHLKELNIEED